MLEELVLVVLTALVCPFAVSIVIEVEDEIDTPTIDAIPIEYMRSQIDCGKWEEIITRWKEKNECNC